eukprot:4682646-Pleurochrysis_carterae.AAC.2
MSEVCINIWQTVSQSAEGLRARSKKGGKGVLLKLSRDSRAENAASAASDVGKRVFFKLKYAQVASTLSSWKCVSCSVLAKTEGSSHICRDLFVRPGGSSQCTLLAEAILLRLRRVGDGTGPFSCGKQM